MPLGIFGGGGGGGPKPQPLTSEKEKKEKRDKGSGSGLLDLKDSKGTTIKLGKKSYMVEKKLAEGGFALVYLVCDKHNRNYALKRQLIRDDPRQIEACRTECQIVKNLNGHKNIVAYVNHQLSVNKVGIYDYMLLTVYYPTNVLQLMNSRLLSNRWLSQTEILDIFCDICEAVARLHHSKTPVIHRDLKVENVLIDQRTCNEKTVYVLCDFGSATTKVLSKETHNQVYMEEEIRRYTTLSYRAPEMIDLFSGVPISTKSDIWALGVMLYKICYFALPFGESALAIQNGSFTFPDQPEISEEIKAIINLLLTSSARHRPNIFQTSYLAFAAANRKCPIYNIERSPRIELTEAVQILRLRAKLGANYSRLFEKAFNDFENAKKNQQLYSQQQQQQQSSSNAELTKQPLPLDSPRLVGENFTDSRNTESGKSELLVSPPVEGVIVNTSTAGPRSCTTSVNPRLRPKATNSSNILSSPFGVALPTSARNSSTTTPTSISTCTTSVSVSSASHHNSTAIVTSSKTATIETKSTASELVMTPKLISATATVSSSQIAVASAPKISSSEQGFDVSCTSSFSALSDDSQPTVDRGLAKSVVLLASNSSNNDNKNIVAGKIQSNDANNISSCLKSSAFKPYSMIVNKQKQRKVGRTTPISSEQNVTNASSEVGSEETVAAIPFESSNPFVSCSASGGFTFVSGSPPMMDDNVFGERFDELRRVNRQTTIETTLTVNSSTPLKIFAPNLKEHFRIPNQQNTQLDVSNQFQPYLQSSQYKSTTNGANVQTHVSAGQSSQQSQQEAFLAAQKQRFVRDPTNMKSSINAPNWLEKAIDEDPFNNAPSFPKHQLAASALNSKSRT